MFLDIGLPEFRMAGKILPEKTNAENRADSDMRLRNREP